MIVLLGVTPWRDRERSCVFAVLNGNPTRWVEKDVQLIWSKAYISLALFVAGSGEGPSTISEGRYVNITSGSRTVLEPQLKLHFFI